MLSYTVIIVVTPKCTKQKHQSPVALGQRSCFHCVVPKNIHTSPSQNGFFLRTPHPSGNSNPFCGGSMDILWNYTVCMYVHVYACTNMKFELAAILASSDMAKGTMSYLASGCKSSKNSLSMHAEFCRSYMCTVVMYIFDLTQNYFFFFFFF